MGHRTNFEKEGRGQRSLEESENIETILTKLMTLAEPPTAIEEERTVGEYKERRNTLGKMAKCIFFNLVLKTVKCDLPLSI